MDRKSPPRMLIDNDSVALWYHPGKKIVHHEFRKFVRGKEFRDVLEKGFEAFRQYGACKWLSDDRGNGPILPADAEWARNDWAPRVMAAGWKYWAVVLPEGVLGQMNMKRWIDEYAQLGVVAQAFSEPGPAMAWLEAQG